MRAVREVVPRRRSQRWILGVVVTLVAALLGRAAPWATAASTQRPPRSAVRSAMPVIVRGGDRGPWVPAGCVVARLTGAGRLLLLARGMNELSGLRVSTVR